MQLLLRLVVNAAALYATVFLLEKMGLAKITSTAWLPWVGTVLVMAFVNSLVRPLVQFLAAPLTCLTLGILGILISGLMFGLIPVIAGAFGARAFEVEFLGAVLGAIMVGLIGGLLGKAVLHESEREKE